MIPEKTFRINLPTLFERVNERRREQGLPSVEPAIMAVRASIKFAIHRQKFMEFKDEQGEVEMDEGDAEALCQALGELFNVDLRVDQTKPDGDAAPAGPAEQPAASAPEAGTTLILPLFQFYASINRERRAKGLQPVEPAVISVRTGIKFSILQRRTLDFQDDELVLSEADLKTLDDIIEQQFDISIPGGLRSLCKTPEAVARTAEAGAGETAERKGLLGRLMGRLKGNPASPGQRRDSHHHTHHYSLDTSNLLLAIITRRAYLGHKPITPDKVRSRCGKALSAELELDMEEEQIALTPEQLDSFAEIIRKEFEIMFEDLDDLLGKKHTTPED